MVTRKNKKKPKIKRAEIIFDKVMLGKYSIVIYKTKSLGRFIADIQQIGKVDEQDVE